MKRQSCRQVTGLTTLKTLGWVQLNFYPSGLFYSSNDEMYSLEGVLSDIICIDVLFSINILFLYDLQRAWRQSVRVSLLMCNFSCSGLKFVVYILMFITSCVMSYCF